MASKKITELPSIPATGYGNRPVTDCQLGASETRKIEVQELAKAVVTLIPDGEYLAQSLTANSMQGQLVRMSWQMGLSLQTSLLINHPHFCLTASITGHL